MSTPAFRSDWRAEVARRVRRRNARKFPGGTAAPDAVTDPGRRERTPGLSDAGRWIFGAVIAIGAAILAWVAYETVLLLGPWGTVGLLLTVAACLTWLAIGAAWGW